IFTNAPDVERFLVKGKHTYAGPWMLFTKPRWNRWGKLTEHLQVRASEQKVLGMYDETFTVERAREYHQATYSIGMGAARRFHRQVDLTGRRKIMDLGGGSGCYCIVAAQNHPDIRAEVLDLPPVVGVTREYLAQNDVSDRVSASPCDFTKDPLPTDADVAIMASNLPQYSRPIMAGVVQP
ncbi:MAG: methyltransferase, partial [Gammaproteobacteria bacterium]